MLPCTSTEMDGVLMTVSTPWWRKFDQDPKIRCREPEDSSLGSGGVLVGLYSVSKNEKKKEKKEKEKKEKNKKKGGKKGIESKIR